MDFSSAPDKLADGLQYVARGLLQHGVTSFCPTIVTSSEEMYKQVWPFRTECVYMYMFFVFLVHIFIRAFFKCKVSVKQGFKSLQINTIVLTSSSSHHLLVLASLCFLADSLNFLTHFALQSCIDLFFS